MRNFVTCELQGRLGNQFLQIASVIATAKRFGLDYYIPSETVSPNTWEFYFKEANFPVFTKDMAYHLDLHKEAQDHSFNPITYINKSILLSGYFQSELYFKDQRGEILKAFDSLYGEESLHDIVSIHVRRGDYLQYSDSFPPITNEYLQLAIKYFVDLGYTKFLVFSDDIEWCKKHFENTYKTLTFIYSEGKTPMEDIKLMIKCEHHIISNSSFSWMGAWMNKNENKIVVSPSSDNWFGKLAGLNTDNIIPKEWIQIKF